MDPVNEIDKRWRELGEFIREQRGIGQLSLRKLSEMAGVSNPYLSQIERGLRKPSAEILQQIATALSISAETLYVRAGILDEPDGNQVDVVGEIRRDPHLSEEQKKTLVHIYRTFTDEHAAAMVEPLANIGAEPASDISSGVGDIDEPGDGKAAEPESLIADQG